ncbi:MAG TPA: hypothetical protein PLJ60_02725 [Chryseolinea sp.]|nr:hypothetical protein [Chryseolinea sp.]HPM29226.1 hypothetical protein [Chryseolinea sp.]
MDEKISLEAIALYADAYADKVLKNFFASKDKITGKEILSLCNVQQANLFIIRELFRTWKEDTRKFKSPYFDFEQADVKEALENFMGVLSNNISIDQPHFAPLLKKAVSQSLLVIFDPYDFFSIIVTGKNNKLEVAPFREEIKYLKINKAPLERMLEKLDEKGVKEISGNEAFAILDQILEEVNFNPEDVEEYIEKFSSVVPLEPNRFYVSKEIENQVIPEPVSVPEAKVVKAPEIKVKVEEPVIVHTPPLVTAKSEPVVAQPAKQTTPTINETLSREPRPSIVDKFQKIGKIKDSLTINQKFMFTKVLFHGDFELFSKAIDHLDRQDNMKAALRYIDDEHASSWDRDSEEFHEFMELVEKRFV